MPGVVLGAGGQVLPEAGLAQGMEMQRVHSRACGEVALRMAAEGGQAGGSAGAMAALTWLPFRLTLLQELLLRFSRLAAVVLVATVASLPALAGWWLSLQKFNRVSACQVEVKKVLPVRRAPMVSCVALTAWCGLGACLLSVT